MMKIEFIRVYIFSLSKWKYSLSVCNCVGNGKDMQEVMVKCTDPGEVVIVCVYVRRCSCGMCELHHMLCNAECIVSRAARSMCCRFHIV